MGVNLKQALYEYLAQYEIDDEYDRRTHVSRFFEYRFYELAPKLTEDNLDEVRELLNGDILTINRKADLMYALFKDETQKKMLYLPLNRLKVISRQSQENK